MSIDSPPLHLSAASGVPYYRQIVDQLAELIRSGQLPPTSRLPSVRELAGELLVSLITIRRSYADLEAAGLIVRRQGYGTFVAEEVQMASHKQAMVESRALLSEAIRHARRLGLDGSTLRKILDELLAEEGGGDGRR
jgi:GntR family transcriptional regulator